MLLLLNVVKRLERENEHSAMPAEKGKERRKHGYKDSG